MCLCSLNAKGRKGGFYKGKMPMWKCSTKNKAQVKSLQATFVNPRRLLGAGFPSTPWAPSPHATSRADESGIRNDCGL